MHLLAALLFAISAQAVPFTLEHFELDVNVDYQAERVDGMARLTIRNVSQAPATDVPLLLNRLMTVKSAGDLAFEQDVLTFTDDTKTQVDAAVVHLREPLAPGAATTLSITYGGHVVGYTENGSLYIKDRINEQFSILREDAYAFPVLGTVNRRLNRKIRRDGFSYDVKVTVPKGFVVAAGGFADQQDSGEKTTFHFATAERVPFVNLAIAKYHVSDANGIRGYTLPADEAGGKLVAQKTELSLALLTKWFGPLAQPPHLTVIEIPTDWGSQANLNAGIILTAESFQDPKWLFELYHELGHLWNPKDLEQPSPRLNEGLSMWLQDQIAQELDGGKPDRGKRMIERLLKQAASDPRVRSTPLASYGQADMTDWSYRTGCIYFYVVESAIGRDALLGVIREWYQTHKTSGATLHDFTALLESRYPKTKAIDADWITSTAWLPKLEAGQYLPR